MASFHSPKITTKYQGLKDLDEEVLMAATALPILVVYEGGAETTFD